MTEDTSVGVASESVMSVSSEVMGTEGFAVLAAAVDGTLVGGRGPRLGVQSQPPTKLGRVSLAMGGTDSFGKSWSSENTGWCSASVDLCTPPRNGCHADGVSGPISDGVHVERAERPVVMGRLIYISCHESAWFADGR